MLALLELANKAEVFARFRWAGGASPESAEALARSVVAARATPPYEAVWAVEGLSQSYALAACRRSREPRNLLTPGLARDPEGSLPRSVLLPLHTGLGLGLAEHALSRRASLARRLQLFEELVAANARSGFRLATFESLGLVASTLFRTDVAEIGALAARRGEETAALFWHGVGRGLYFSPLFAFPGGTFAALGRADAEAPDATARANAVAGVAWALTLVNQRHPRVANGLLEASRFRLGAAAQRAMAQGVGAALAVWEEATGEPPVLSPHAAVRFAFRASRRLAQVGRIEEVFRLKPPTQFHSRRAPEAREVRHER